MPRTAPGAKARNPERVKNVGNRSNIRIYRGRNDPAVLRVHRSVFETKPKYDRPAIEHR